MNVLNLRALTLSNKYYVFSIKDIPVLIDANNFILMRRPNSPILRFDTITSLTDIPNIGEGTVLLDNAGKEYTVSFKRGFAAMTNEHKVFKLSDMPPYTIKQGGINLSTNYCRQRLLFKYDDIQFQIRDLIGAISNHAIIRRNHSVINMGLVQQYIGLTYNGAKVFLGDCIGDGVVTLFKGRVCIKQNSRYFDMVDGNEIERTK